MGIEEDLAAIKLGVDELRNADANTISVVFKFIGKVSDIVGVLSGPGAVIQLVSILKGLLGGLDETTERLQEINNLLKVTFRFEQGEAEQTKMHLVNSHVDDIRSSLQAILQESPPYTPASLDRLEISTLSNLNAFDHDDQDSYWNRAFFDELVYSDHWFGRVVPKGIVRSRSGQQYVFDYRLTLPAYLKAIAVRSAAISILISTGFIIKAAVLDELKARVTSAQGFYDKIVAAIIPSRTPHLSEIAYLDLHPFVPAFSSIFEPFFPIPPTSRPMGAILSYDGSGIVDSYPPSEYPTLKPPLLVDPKGPLFDIPPFPQEYLRFAARYALGTRKRTKQLYTKIGLDQAWATIQVLRIQAGITPKSFDPMQYWSVRDIISDLGLADAEVILVQPGAPPPDLSLWNTVRRLADIGKLDRNTSFLVSMQQALSAATP